MPGKCQSKSYAFLKLRHEQHGCGRDFRFSVWPWGKVNGEQQLMPYLCPVLKRRAFVPLHLPPFLAPRLLDCLSLCSTRRVQGSEADEPWWSSLDWTIFIGSETVDAPSGRYCTGIGRCDTLHRYGIISVASFAKLPVSGSNPAWTRCFYLDFLMGRSKMPMDLRRTSRCFFGLVKPFRALFLP